MASNVPKIYAKIYTLPQPKLERQDDPFLSSSETSPGKGPERISRIPRPARDVGNGRKTYSPSPSPPKSPQRSPSPPKRLTPKKHLKKRPSVFDIVPNHNADMVKHNNTRNPETAGMGLHSALSEEEPNTASTETAEQVASQLTNLLHNQDALDEIIAPQPSRSPPPPPPRKSSYHHKRTSSSIYLDVAPTRPLSAYSVDSLRRMRLEDEPPVAQHIPTRVISIEVKTNECSNTGDVASQSGLDGPKRKGSFNTAMSAEISRLRRLVEQKDREVRETRRSLDASREIWEDAVSKDGSPKKGTLANELRMSKKEAAEWKKRAEWAESRLAVVDGGKKPETESRMRPSTPRRGSSGVEKPRDWFHE